MENNLLGDNIARLRKQNKMTQVDLANKLNFTYQTISSWERGISSPDVDSLTKLCSIFNVSMDELCGIENPIENTSTKQEEEQVGLFSKVAKNKIIKIERVSKAVDVFNKALVFSIIFWAISLLLSIPTRQTFFLIFLNLLVSLALSASYITAFISLFCAKKKVDKLWIKIVFYLLTVIYILVVPISAVIALLKTQNEKLIDIFRLLSALVYIPTYIFFDLMFKDESPKYCPKIYQNKAVYYICLAISIIFMLTLKTSVLVIDLISFFFLFKHKQDKTYITYGYAWQGKPVDENAKKIDEPVEKFSYGQFLNEKFFKVILFVLFFPYIPLFFALGLDENQTVLVVFLFVYPPISFLIACLSDRKRTFFPLIISALSLVASLICFYNILPNYPKEKLIYIIATLLLFATTISYTLSLTKKFKTSFLIIFVVCLTLVTALIILLLTLAHSSNIAIEALISLIVGVFHSLVIFILTIIPRKKD